MEIPASNIFKKKALFEIADAIIRAPGRVNLIGEHTDYNEGFVLPIAIDKEVRIAIRKSNNQKVVLYSQEYKQQLEFDLQDFQKGFGWGEYIKGVAWALQEEGYILQGWQGILSSDIPQGAGLSSSAAVEMAAIQAFSFASGLKLDKQTMAKLGRKAENEWVGVKCGIMDQMTSVGGLNNHALLIDCRSLEIKKIPLPPDISFVVLDTMTRHNLLESGYNERREQCIQAAKNLGIDSLRDIRPEEFYKVRGALDPIIARRAEHVVFENQRVIEAVAALKTNDSKKFGKLISESHASLRDLFEVSSPDLNIMVECAMRHNDCRGARMMGAGFGGSVIAIVKTDQIKSFITYVKRCYSSKTGIHPDIYQCKAVDGAGIFSL